MNSDELNNLLSRYDTASQYFSRYYTLFEQCAKYSWANISGIFADSISASGDTIKTIDVYDSTAMRACYEMSIGIFANLMPAGTKWFEFIPFIDDEQLTRACAKISDTILRFLYNSDTFAEQMIAKIRSKIVFGNGCISPDWDDDTSSIVFRTYSIKNILFEENTNRVIDTVFRRLWWTARQIRQFFGQDNLPEHISSVPDNRKFEILHCVFPRADYEAGKKDTRGKKFRSVYIDMQTRTVLKEDNGYNDMPYIVGRYEVLPDETVGIGLVPMLLADIKMLNEMMKTYIIASEKLANPPVMVETDTVVNLVNNKYLNTSAGSVIMIEAGSKEPKPFYVPVQLTPNRDLIMQYRQDIERGFFLNLFNVLEGYRNMTRAEVVQRATDSLSLLSALINSELNDLNRIIMRIYNILVDKNIIEPLPVDFRIIYNSRLAMALNVLQANAIENVLAKWAPVQSLHPVMDNIKLDEAFRLSAIAQGVPMDIIKEQAEVTRLRQERQNQQQQQELLKNAESVSKAIKNVGQVINPEMLL